MFVLVHEFQNDVVNPRIGQTVGVSPLVTFLSVAVVGVLFGGLVVILAGARSPRRLRGSSTFSCSATTRPPRNLAIRSGSVARDEYGRARATMRNSARAPL